MVHQDLDPGDVDLCDLDRFAQGFPHDVFSWLRGHRPVWFHPPTPNVPGGEGFWVLSGYAEVLAAASDGATFSSVTGGGREGGGTLIEDLPMGFAGALMNMTDDPFHQRFRSLLTPSVAPRAIAAMESDLRARAARIVDEAVERGRVDLLVEVAAELPLQAAASLLGVPQEDRARLIGWADATLDDGLPLDLTHSALRSVSPVHREYMRNMGTAASLTIGLAHGRELWGMLVCHHATPRVAGPDLRAAAGTIGQVVSLLLESLGESEVLAHRLVRGVILGRLSSAMSAAMPLAQALAAAQSDLLHLVDATGAVLRLSGAYTLLGHTPPAAAAQRALEVLLAQAGGELLAIDDLGLRLPELAECTAAGSGCLLLPLGAGGDDAILWWRPEWSRTVTWAGNPAVHGSVDAATARISPRASFTAWQETVHGRSAPWTDADLTLARELHHALQAEVVKRTRAALLESEARLGLLAEHSGVVVALTDLDGVRRYVSPAAERVLGWRPQDMVDRNALDFIHADDQQGVHEARQALLGEAGQGSATYRFRRPDGSWLWVDDHARLRPGRDGDEPRDCVAVLRDATERKAAETKLVLALERMAQMAATDGLTGLANRRHLDTVAAREWRRCARQRQPLSMLLLDVDRFKRYNDHYGHLAGDDCLRKLASQVAAVAQRPGDLAARYGGEEFLVLLPQTDREGALTVARRLRTLVQGLGLVHAGIPGPGLVTVSIGVATAWPGDPHGAYTSMDALVSGADAALYKAKRDGRNQVVADADARGEDGAA